MATMKSKGKKKKKEVKNKEENAENWCFICKDGGDLRICDHKKCLKSFHPECIEKDDSFLESEDHWTCSWHLCFNCHRSSRFHCYTCTEAVCRHCLPKTDFLQVKGKYGFCDACLKLALLIEENKDYDSDGEKVDFTDRETWEGLFMEYYMIIKGEEGFDSRDIYAAQDQVKKKKKNHKSRSDSEDEEKISDYDDMAYEKKCKRKREEKRSEKKKSITPKKSNQMEFVGWASKSLMEFLASIGKNKSEKLSQDEVSSIVNEYVQENKLFHPQKNKTIICDARLKPLFKKKTIKTFRVSDLLEDHFAENQDVLEEEYDSKNDNASIPSACKKQRKMDVEKIMENKKEVENDVARCGFAAIVDENVKLVYLKRSVLHELLKEPESFEEKVIGCFVRVQSGPYDNRSQNSYQLVQVKGVKAVSVGENNVDAVLLFSTMPKEIGISLLSDSDFSKEECEVLRRKILSGQFERPTVGDLQERAKIVHKNIIMNRISKELALLQIKIDQANEKGWRREYYEYLAKRRTLQSPSEQSKLLENVPRVIPDISELHSDIEDIKTDVKSDEGSPTSILQCDNAVPGTSEEKAQDSHASPQENIQCKKEQEDDENANDGKVNSVLLDEKKLDDNLVGGIWYISGPHIEKFKCSLSLMKNWNDTNPHASEFKVWKVYQNEADAISLPDAINIAFSPK